MTKIEAVAYNLACLVVDANPEHPLERLQFIEHLACGFAQTLRTANYVAELQVSGMLHEGILYKMGDLV